jgi:hypothetical protein
MKIRLIYQSPYTDEPSIKYTSIPLNLLTLLFDHNPEIEFEDGGYLMLKEMEKEYTKIEIIKGEN